MYARSALAVQNLFSTLATGDVAQARRCLELIEFDGSKGARMRDHYSAQILMRERKFSEASALMRQSLERYGEYVGLQTDLSVCYHELGQFDLLETTLSKIEAVLSDLTIPLSPERRLRYTCWLLKHLEFQGKVGSSIELLNLLQKNSEGYLSQEHRIYFHIQELRLLSIFESSLRVKRAYEVVLAVDESRMNSFHRVERLHCLMLAETQLFGVSHGLNRLLQIFSHELASDRESDFAEVDFLFAASVFGALKNEDGQHEVLNRRLSNEASAFEFLMEDLYTGRCRSALQSLQRLDQFSLQERLLVLLYAGRMASQADRMEILKRLKFELIGLDEGSIRLWNALIQKCFSAANREASISHSAVGARGTSQDNSQIHSSSLASVLSKSSTSQPESGEAIVFTLSLGLVRADGQPLKTGPAATLRAVLLQLSQNGSVSTEVLSTEIWGDYDSSHLARLKMFAKRLNDEIFECYGQKRLIQVTKEETRLLLPIRISQKAEGLENA